MLLHMQCTAFAAPASPAFGSKPDVGTRMGLEVETATEYPHELQREKKRKEEQKSLPFCSQPRQQMTKLGY
jgi:hypothetical protein